MVSILLGCLLIILCQPAAILGTTIGDDVTHNLPIESHMETVAETTYVNSQVNLTAGSASLTQDRVKGNYAINVVIGDLSNQAYTSFNLAASNPFNISENSGIKLWVKPGARAKSIKFYTANTLITSDTNSDGVFEVGKDLISGKWNEINLDLNKTQTKITQGNGLKVEVNDSSTWLFDEVSSVCSATFAVDLSRMVNSHTRLNNGALEFQPKTGDTFDTTPSVLVSQKSDSVVKSARNQDDFTGTHENTQAVCGSLSLGAESHSPIDSYTKLLMHMDYGNNAVTFTDETGKTITRNGDTYINTAVKKYGSGSARFDGNGDYLSFPDSDDWYFDTGKFTIDTWVNFSDLSGTQAIYSQAPTDNNNTYISFLFSSGCLEFRVINNVCWKTRFYCNWTPAVNTWYHVALVQNNANWYMFIDGVSQPLTLISGSYDCTLDNLSFNPVIGRQGYWDFYLNGYIDEFHISKGIARWTSNFTPPVPDLFYTTGTYTHPVQDLSGAGELSNSLITYNKSTPPGTGIIVETRYSSDGGTNWSPWEAKNSGDSFIPAGVSLVNCRAQWRANLNTGDTTVTPQLSNIVMTVESEYNDSPALPVGKIERILIDSGYSNLTGAVTELPSTKVYLTDVTPTMAVISGDGHNVYFKNPGDANKIYLLDLDTGVKTKIADNVPVDIKCNYDGTKAAYRDASNNLYLGTALVSSNVTMYSVNNSGNIVYYKTDSSLNLYNTISQNIYSGSVSALDISRNGEQVFYSTAAQLNKVVKTPAGWKSSLLTTASANISGLWSNDDGSSVYIKLADGTFYVYEAYSKSLRKLSLTGATVNKICDDKIIGQDANFNYFIYDPESDETTDIRPIDAKNPPTANDFYFDVDQSASLISYVACNSSSVQTGLGVSSLETASATPTAIVTTGAATLPAGARRPERYLFSFDNKGSWHSYKNGVWEVVTHITPVKADFDTYGMTIDEVNALSENDFSSLYEGGRQIVAFDVSTYFASVNPYVTPSLKGIIVTLKQTGNSFGNELTEKALFAAKQQIFDGTNWRKIRKIYPVEIAAKDSQMYYLINVDNTYKAYKNDAWQDVSATLLDNVETSWIDLSLQAMTAEELRAIPENALTDILRGKSFSVVYCMKVLDQTTKEYKSLVNIDYVEDLFTSTTLILNVVYNNGTTATYNGLSDTQVEDFMQWLTERQFNRGPIYYRIKTSNNNDFINYFMIQSVNVTE